MTDHATADFDREHWQKSLTPEDKEFEDNLRKLVDLLNEPHPGLSTWHLLRVAKAQEIVLYLLPRVQVTDELAAQAMAVLHKHAGRPADGSGL